MLALSLCGSGRGGGVRTRARCGAVAWSSGWRASVVAVGVVVVGVTVIVWAPVADFRAAVREASGSQMPLGAGGLVLRLTGPRMAVVVMESSHDCMKQVRADVQSALVGVGGNRTSCYTLVVGS